MRQRNRRDPLNKDNRYKGRLRVAKVLKNNEHNSDIRVAVVVIGFV